MRIEKWCGHDIRFVLVEGEWYAILKDICDALGLKSKHVAERIPQTTMKRVLVDVSKVGSNDIGSDLQISIRKPGDNKTRWMIAVNELGIYEAMFASRKVEARKFRAWTGTVLQKLRKNVGLEGYEVMRMTEPEIQKEIDDILDLLYWDEETEKLMISVTIEGGDVDQVEFE